MKTNYLIYAALLLSAGSIFGQNLQLKAVEDQAGMVSDLFEPDSRTNMTFISYTNCPLLYTNVISNTNLFTPSEQTSLEAVLSKYKNVTTNSGPAGTVLTSLEKMNDCYIAHFSYTNSDAHEDIIFGDRSAEARHDGNYNDFITGLGLPLAKFRTKDGNGYDATISRSSDKFSTFAQIKQGKINGLFVDFSNDHCQDLLHFENGKAIGKWLQWDTYRDNHLLEVKIKSSVDYFKYMTQKVEM